ncbi:MAG: Aquaporin Z [uncultured Friedmanniella sp.]|uniref:Aquaporin Z n=1 Tax=uncultured Friedmanniella sp. TaxID=335381 RepID=A0A6J4KMJ2_9ACTN|nr:aquaporin [uncultured Friedmanniella sp.]CAA9309103.1 MAG: Aquaporin Z [uncultured Friedmanniella sp.]
MNRELLRRALAELLGTAFLVAAVVGSGIAAVRLSPDDVGLQLLENSLITGAVLVALILALQPVSAAFNPVVTLVERALGAISTGTAAVLILAQVVGGALGAVLANLMFDLPAVSVSTSARAGGGVWLAEVVATVGLLVVIFGTVRSGRGDRVAIAVGGYITAAYWFTSSTSFANPAVTIARMLSDTFAGIAPSSVPLFVSMQLVGGLVGLGLIRLLYPDAPGLAGEVASDSPVESPRWLRSPTAP